MTVRPRPWRKALFVGAIVVGIAASRALMWADPVQDKFVPIDQLPAQDTLPGGPLLYAAYAFVWGALVTYLFVLWRRIGRVERELTMLAHTTRDQPETRR